MRRHRLSFHFLLLAAIAPLLMCEHSALAQLSMTWYTVDGGGRGSTSGTLSMIGTVGQPDAQVVSSNGTLSFQGGFWPGATPSNDCPADTNSDGTVNVSDLLAVISSWGACPGPCPPSSCPADVNKDCFINVSDLLAVISAWGPCP